MAKPGVARALKIVILAAPVLFSAAVAWLLGRIVPPSEIGIPTIPWFAGVTVLSTGTLILSERVLRRAAPLPVLLSLALVFPDDAPNRYRMAMKAGSTRQLARRIDEIRSTGMALDSEQNYAEQMLELLALLSAHDRLTRGHCERVRAYTDLIIEEMGIPEKDAGRLRWAALLHDLGKLMVPSEILNKPGKPTDEEWEILKSHTWQGARMAEPLAEWLGEWKAAIGEHHERWDGGGYPNGLAGTQIHLGARIVSVADTYDVMTSARSYKKPLPAEVAREEIARCAGGQFDPDVARAFLAVGVSRLRFVAGPLSWLTSWVGASSVTTAGTSTLAVAASAGGAVVTAVVTAVVPAVFGVEDPIEDNLAFVIEEAEPDTQRDDEPAQPTLVEAEPVAVISGILAAGDDHIQLEEGGTLVFDVLLNDVSPDGELSVTEFTAASAGQVGFDGRLFEYRHDGSETHEDGFTYSVAAGDGAVATGSVVVAIAAVNDPPTLTAADFSVPEWARAGHRIGTVVAEDPDSSTIAFSTESSHAAIDSDGRLTLVVDADSIDGSVTVDVLATDDQGAATGGRYRVWVGAENVTTTTTRPTTASTTTTTTMAPTTTTSTTTAPTTTTTTAPTTTTTAAPTTTTTAAPTTTTTTAPPAGAGLVVSEFSAAGANPDGDFVELYNGTGAAVDLATVDVDLLDDSGVFETVDLGTGTLPAGTHFLLAKSGSALAGGADVTFSASLPLAFAAAVDGSSGYLDVVGTRNRPEAKPSIVAASAAMEGTGVPPFDPDSTTNPQSYVRRYGTTGGSCVDTDDNSADFIRSFHSAGVTPTASAAGTFACGTAGSSPGAPGYVVISEIRTDGPGAGSNEFVELFNPTGVDVALLGMQLINDESEVQYLFTTEVIPAGRRMLLAHPDFTGPTPDYSYIGGGVKNGGGLTLEMVAGGADIDRVSFGGSSPDLPPLGGRLQHSYSRRFGGCIDTGDYYVDFEHTLTETPQGLSAPVTSC